MAVLAGDGLLSYAFELMLESIPYGTDEIVPYLRAVKRIAAAAGHNGMIAGQAMDLLSEGKEPDAEVLQYIHRHKTGAILSASVLAAAIAAGADERQLDALERYAAAIGLAFQLADDVLDIRGDKGKVGKTIGKDQAAQKLTYPLVYGMDQTLAKLQELNVEAAESLASFGAEARFLIETADFICKRDY
jgi:geranylgeranyl diphosphate synthase type II